MQTLEELKTLIVTLITAAKAEDGSTKMTAQTASTWIALDEYSWTALKEGTSDRGSERWGSFDSAHPEFISIIIRMKYILS